MAVGFELDLNETDENLDSGSILGPDNSQPGFYHVRIQDVYLDTKDPDRMKFKNTVLTGPFSGSLIFCTYENPRLADNPKAAYTRMASIAVRLGIKTKAEVQAMRAAGESYTPDFSESIGQECFLELSKHKDGQVWPAYVPFYPMADERVPEAVRRAAGAEITPKGKPATNGAAAEPATQLTQGRGRNAPAAEPAGVTAGSNAGAAPTGTRKGDWEGF